MAFAVVSGMDFYAPISVFVLMQSYED